MLILAQLEHDQADAVILNGVTVYHDDDDKGYSNSGFSAEKVAERLSEALKLPVSKIALTVEEAGGEEWNFDTIREVAVAKYEATLFIQINVGLSAERAPMKQVTTGYYRLTADVKNPKPDRRSKRRMDCAEVWKAGTVVFVKDESAARLKHLQEIAGERLPEDATVLPLGQVRFNDGTHVLFSFEGSSNNFPEERQGNPIFDAIEPAPKTLGQVLKQADWRAEDLLALLIDAGKITLNDVDEIKQKDLTPEVGGNNWQVRYAATDAFQKRHGIS